MTATRGACRDGRPADAAGQERGRREGRLVVALVRGLHGLRGAVRVEALTDRPVERFAQGRQLYREGSDEPLTVASGVVDGPGWRLRFEEIPDRTSAEHLRGAYLEAAVGPDGELGRGEYYWHEVVGAAVRDLDGHQLGRVVDVYRAGGVDAYVVRGEPYGEFDLPAVRHFIRIFAPRRGEIVVDAAALDLTPPRIRPQREPRPRRATRRRAAVPHGASVRGSAPADDSTATGTAVPPVVDHAAGSEGRDRDEDGGDGSGAPGEDERRGP